MIKVKESLSGSVSSKESLSGSLNIGVEKVYPALQEKEVTPSGEIQEITADKGVYGLSKVTVDKVNLQDKSVTPSSSEQVVKADSNYAGLNEVTVNKPITEDKEITPTKETQIVVPSDNKFLSSVTVNGDDNLTPENIADGKTIFNVVGAAKVEVEETFDLSTIDPYGMEEILRNDNYNNGQYSKAVMLLLVDSYDTISLKGAVAYKTSDGQFYKPTSYSTAVVHTWDKSKDVINSEGNKTRWVIFYDTNTGLYNANKYNEVVAYFADKETTTNRYGTGFFNEKIPNVQYIKFINVEGKKINFDEAFRQLYNLRLVEGLDESYISNNGPELSFTQCNSLLKFPNIKMGTENYGGWNAFMQSCYKNREIPNFDYENPLLAGILYAAFQDNDLRKVGKFSSTSMNQNSNYLFANNYNLTEVEEVNLPNSPNTSYMFQNDRNLKRIGKIDVSSSKDISYMFASCISLVEIPYMDTSKATNMSGMFSVCRNLRVIYNLDFSSATSVGNMFNYCTSLREIKSISNINIALTLSNSKMLTHDTLIKILNALVDLTGQTSKQLTLGTENLSKLNDEEKAIAINKNWTLK